MAHQKDVLVTGATGFVGAHAVPRLLEAGHRVTVLARDPARVCAMPWGGSVGVLVHDLLAGPPPDLPFSWLMHLAWPGLNDFRALAHFETVLPASYALIRRAVECGAQRVLVAGTCLEYGLREGELAADSPTDPHLPYPMAKDALHRQLRFLAAERPFDLVWARLFYMHGAGQRDSTLFAHLARAIAAGLPCFDMSGGEQLRDYLPVEEAAAQLVAALRSGVTGPVNVCSGRPRAVRSLVERAVAEAGARIELNLGARPYPAHEPMAFWGRKGA